MDAITDTWQIHNRINLYVLDAIPETMLNTVAATKGRSVGEHLAHMHNVRLMWLKAAAPELIEAQTKLEKGTTLTIEALSHALAESGEAISQLLTTGVALGKIKNFKPHPTAFLGYLISHESHHRAQVILILKEAGYKFDKKISFGMWEWGVR